MSCTASEKRVAKQLLKILNEKDRFLDEFKWARDIFGIPRVSKPLEGIFGCKNIWKGHRRPRPRRSLSHSRDLRMQERLEGSLAPKVKKVSAAGGIFGCKNVWKGHRRPRSRRPLSRWKDNSAATSSTVHTTRSHWHTLSGRVLTFGSNKKTM